MGRWNPKLSSGMREAIMAAVDQGYSASEVVELARQGQLEESSRSRLP